MRKRVILDEVRDGFLSGRSVSPAGASVEIGLTREGDAASVTYRRGDVYHRVNVIAWERERGKGLEDRLAREAGLGPLKPVGTWIRKWDRE